jgi:AcrR family transcriptional regulator
MARKPAPGTRDRILDSAARLFYDQGVHAVGVQQVIDDCGCGKNLLYREFTSKDDLIVAYLNRCREGWAETMERITAPLAGDPAAQLVAIVRSAAEKVVSPDYRGCPFQNVNAEFPDPDHPANKASVEHRSDVRAKLKELSEEAGARDPDTLADRLLLIMDGISANGAIFGSEAGVATAVSFAEEVVRAATQ